MVANLGSSWLRTALTFRWLSLLVLALLVSGTFAFLGRWQLERALLAPPEVSSQVGDLEQVAPPLQQLSVAAVGRRVEAEATLLLDETLLVGERNQEGRRGYWVVAPLRTASGATVPAALGFGENEAQVRDLQQQLRQLEPLTGSWQGSLHHYEPPPDRVLPAALFSGAEGYRPLPAKVSSPSTLGGSPAFLALNTMSGAVLVNLWAESRPLLSGFLVLESSSMPAVVAGAGLEPIVSAPYYAQDGLASVNWLNMFYALEWVVFAGFALYMWYRLVRDASEREADDAQPQPGQQLLSTAEAAASPYPSSGKGRD